MSHSHRYIHEGFYTAFKYIFDDCVWVDDKPSNNDLITPGCLVISVNLASNHLGYRKDVKYVLHNNESELFKNRQNVLNLQVFTKDSKGKAVDDSCAMYDFETSTLYQPWGIPSQPSSWLKPAQNLGKTEYWIGSIWNNELNQGNTDAIAEYRNTLNKFGFNFEHANKMKLGIPAVFGGRGIWLPTQIDDVAAAKLVNKSPVGSSIVGNWQRENGYIPCRLFKNLAAGQIASSNSDFSHIFHGASIYSMDFEQLIETLVTLNWSQRNEHVVMGQRAMLNYTYEKALERMLACF